MKIAFVIEHFNPRYGGQQVYMRDFAEFLVKRGHEVSFFTQDSNVKNVNLSINIINVPALAKLMRWSQWLSFLTQVKHKIQQGNFDVVMGTGISAGINVYQPHGGVSKASHRQNRLLTNRFHRFLKGLSNAISPKHLLANRIERNIFTDKRVKYVAISQMVKRHMQEFYKIDETQLELVYNGVDVERFNPHSASQKSQSKTKLSLKEDVVVFSLVAHNFKLKGLKEIIDVVDLLRVQHDNFIVLIAGNGKTKNYKKMIAKKSLEKHFKFLGSVDDPELIYSATDVYLQPTWYDPCSLVVLEAMAAGLPVISTSFNGASELIESGVNGYVIEKPDSINEFYEALNALMDCEHRKVLGKKARLSVEGLTHEKNFSRMEEVFQGCVEEKQKRTL
ncbi:glycosyltransferase family 4 protein [Lentisphaera profundi]|uniref:Glycosyltransferase family 4 protein n=1 Tax=Lentisphaera profundi TaxID=1658616 RepID=A0ABY7VVS3_9BACT|nr:glycosyltransferase family 4 protein [Lentisphaera profundi]WDE98328.1 glycosyltransferase family 4 protein [Lentisphaera profundi]